MYCASGRRKAQRKLAGRSPIRGPPLEYWGGGINIFLGEMGEITKWPQGMVEIQPVS